MTHKKFLFGMLAMALVFGITAVGCDSGDSFTVTVVDPPKQTVAKPSASPEAGDVVSGTTVTLSAVTADAEIWYTTNGDTPAKNGVGSTKYTNPIIITELITPIKAIAVKDGMDDSEVLEVAYTIGAGGIKILNVFNVGSTAEWNTAANAIYYAGNNREYIINITDNFYLPGKIDDTFIPQDLTVTIQGNKTISLSGTGFLLRIGERQNIIVRDVNLQGSNTNTYSLIYIGGSFTMEGNASVYGNTDNKDIGSSHGGVEVSGGGTFIMRDNASVYNNTGTLSGLSSSGGVSVGGTFIMQDNASVHDNTAAYGGGVYVLGGIFIMEDNASVYSNIASGGGSFGGGVYVAGTFTMRYNASVSGNTATITSSAYSYVNRFSGGVYVTYSGIFTMNDSASINSNTASSKGGTNSNSVSGGVYVAQTDYSAGTFLISGGTIFGNNGAALYLEWRYTPNAQYGTFDNEGNFTKNGDLSSTNDTIKVVNGVLQ